MFLRGETAALACVFNAKINKLNEEAGHIHRPNPCQCQSCHRIHMMPPEGGIFSQCHTRLPLSPLLFLSGSLTMSGHTLGEMSCTTSLQAPTPGAVPVFISCFISLVRCLNVSLQMKQDYQTVQHSATCLKTSSAVPCLGQKNKICYDSYIMSLHPYG